MGYKTTLRYICDMCAKEYIFKEIDNGPDFNQDGWKAVGVRTETYHKAKSDNTEVHGIFCPDCVKKYSVIELIQKIV